MSRRTNNITYFCDMCGVTANTPEEHTGWYAMSPMTHGRAKQAEFIDLCPKCGARLIEVIDAWREKHEAAS